LKSLCHDARSEKHQINLYLYLKFLLQTAADRSCFHQLTKPILQIITGATARPPTANVKMQHLCARSMLYILYSDSVHR